MKPQTTRTILKATLVCGLVAFAVTSRAADIVKADNADNLTLTTSWVGGVVPTSAGVAVWDSTITVANTTVLDVSTNWAGLRIASPVGLVTINSNATVQVLGLGASGIDLSAATVDLTINAPISNFVNQTWSIASGRTLNQNGALSGSGRLTKVGVGTLAPAGLNGAFAGGLTIAETSVQTVAALNGGGVSAVIGTNTLVLTNGGRLRFQNSSGTGAVNYNVPLQMDGAGTISFRANSTWGSPPITGSGTLTIDPNNGVTGVTLTPTSFSNWNGRITVTCGTGGGFIRLATSFLNASMTNLWLDLSLPNAQLNRQSASATTVEIGTLSGAVGSSVNGNAVRTGWRNEDSTFAGVFTGANGITKVGSGTMTLTTNSTHGGNTTVQGGKLLCITGGSFSNSATTFVTNGGVLSVQLATASGQWSVGTNLVFTAVPSATNTLELNYVGFPASTVTAPLQVRGNVTNLGPVNVSIKGGGWAIGNYPLISFSGVLGGLGTSGFVITNLPSGIQGYITNDIANTLSLVVTNSALPLHWRVGNGNWDIATTTNWKDNNGVTTTYQESAGSGFPVQLDDTASGSSPITITLVANVVPSGVTVTNVSLAYILAGANTIGGGTPVTKLGSGTLTIQNNNSFTGGLNLNGGTVEFTSDANLGGASSTVTFNGGTLRYAAGATADFSARTTTFAAGGATIDDNGNTVTLARPIGNNGAGGFTKTGAGSLTLTGTNRYNGPTTIVNGTLALATATTFISNSAAINIAGSATLSGTVALSTPVSQLLYGTGTVLGNLSVPASTRVSPATNGVYGMLTNSGSLTVSGGTLSMDVATTSRDEIVVSGTVTFTSGTLALNFGNTLTNGTYRLLQCGSVTPGSEANLVITSSGVAQPNKVLSISEAVAGRIDLVVTGFRGSNIVWVGDSSLNYWDVESSTNWTNLVAATSEKFFGGDKVTFNDTGSLTPAVDVQDFVQPGSVTVNATGNYTFSASGSGKIGGTTGLTKSGTGTLIINTENNNTGGTLVSGGVLQVGSGSGGDVGPGPVTNNALVVFNQGTAHTAPAISGSGHIQHQGASQLTLLADNTYAGTTTVGASSRLQVGNGGAAGALGSGVVTNDGVLAFNRTGTHTVANGITGTGSLQKLGTSVLTLGGANSYDGNTYISNGVVKLGASQVIPDGGATTGWLILDGGATAGALDLNGFNETVNALSGVTGATLGYITNSSGSPTTTNTLTLNQAFSTTFAGFITDNPTGGKVALAKYGIGDLNLPINNLFSGGMTLAEGIVNATGNSPCGTGLITMSNGTYNMSGSIFFPGNIARVVDGGNATLTSASLANGWAGSFESTNANAKLNIGVNVSFSSGNVKQFSNYTALVEVIAGGNLRWSASSGLNNGGDNTIFRITSTGAMFARNVGTISLGALEGDGFLTGTTTGGTATYILGMKGTNTTFSGTISGTGAANNAIVKAGPATQTFSGTLSYDGSTTVSNGVLAIAGAAELTNTSQINLRQPGTLDMTGSSSGGLNLGLTVAQALTGEGTNLGWANINANSAVRPGNGAGLIGNLTVSGAFTNNGTIAMELNPTNSPATNDLITAASVRVTGGTLTVTNVGPDLNVGDTFKLFSVPVSGAFATVSLPVSNVLNTIAYTWMNKLAIDGTIKVLTAGVGGGPSTNAYLTNLVVTPAGTLSPVFDSNTVSYAAVEAYPNSPITVTPTSADAGATLQVIYGGVTNAVTSGSPSGPLTLNANPSVPNVVQVQVTAADAVTVKSYTVTVTRQPSLTPPTLSRTFGGGNLTLSWPTDHTGWSLLTQTNTRALGLRTNWFTVTGSTATNSMVIPVGPVEPTVFYRLFYFAP